MQTSDSEATPWRIFVCMLDKWEIGGPLTDCLVYDALRTCYNTFSNEANRDSDVCPLYGSCVPTTSHFQTFVAMFQLYEAVQPWAFWKQIFLTLYTEIKASQHRTEVNHSH